MPFFFQDLHYTKMKVRNLKMKLQICAVVLPILTISLWGDWQAIHHEEVHTHVANRLRWGRFKTLENYDFERAIFAGGSFWHLQAAFHGNFVGRDGVVETMVGYTGGGTLHPSFYTAPFADHLDAVIVYYDKTRVSYAQLLAVFLASTDPFDGEGQFCDRGASYRSMVVATTKRQFVLASEMVAFLKENVDGKAVYTKVQDLSALLDDEVDSLVLPSPRAVQAAAQTANDFTLDERWFYPAEERHQHVRQRSLAKYLQLTKGCGFSERLSELKPALQSTQDMLRGKLVAF